MTRTTLTLEKATSDYAEQLLRTATRRLNAKRRGADADDIASEIVLKFLATPEVLMAQYPDPQDYLRLCLANACIAHDRKQRAQRSEGVRLRDNGDGTKSASRPWISGDATFGDSDHTLFSTAHCPTVPFEDRVAERIDAHRDFQKCCAGVPAGLVDEAMAVHGHERQINQVAKGLRQRRETVSRRVKATCTQMRQNLPEGRNAKDTPA